VTKIHHITEKKILEEAKCPYCHKSFDRMVSHFEHPFHYKRFDCSCGRNFMVRVGPGSGHDSFNEQFKKNLDAVVEEE